jgi:hypothetical protein
MVFIDWNHEIQALPTCATDQALAKSIRLRRAVGRSQYSESQCSEGAVQVSGIDVVTVVNDELVSFLSRNALSELLKRPFRRRMLSHVHMKNPPRADLHDDQHIDKSKCCGHYDEEVRSNDRVLGELPKIMRQWESDRVHDNAAATGMNQSPT